MHNFLKTLFAITLKLKEYSYNEVKKGSREEGKKGSREGGKKGRRKERKHFPGTRF